MLPACIGLAGFEIFTISRALLPELATYAIVTGYEYPTGAVQERPPTPVNNAPGMYRAGRIRDIHDFESIAARTCDICVVTGNEHAIRAVQERPATPVDNASGMYRAGRIRDIHDFESIAASTCDICVVTGHEYAIADYSGAPHHCHFVCFPGEPG